MEGGGVNILLYLQINDYMNILPNTERQHTDKQTNKKTEGGKWIKHITPLADK